MPAATVDEGNNWINLRWGPLSMDLPNPGNRRDLDERGAQVGLAGNRRNSGDSKPDIQPVFRAPSIDFYGNTRKTPGNQLVDAGAIEIVPTPTFSTSVSPTTLNFGAVANGQNSDSNVTVTNSGNQQLTG